MIYKVMLIYKREVGLTPEKANAGDGGAEAIAIFNQLMGGNRKMNLDSCWQCTAEG